MTYEEQAARTLADAEDSVTVADGTFRPTSPEYTALVYGAAAVGALVGIGWALLAVADRLDNVVTAILEAE